MKTGIPQRLEICAKVFAGGRDPAGKSELARRTGIPLRTLDKYFNGAKLPLDRAAAIAKAAGKSLMWLATGDGGELAVDLPVRSTLQQPGKEESAVRQERPFETIGSGFAEPQSRFQDQIDTSALTDIVVTLEQFLRDTKRTLEPEKKAEVISLMYEMHAAGEFNGARKKPFDRATMQRLLRLVA
jgi:Helix-turn-helix